MNTIDPAPRRTVYNVYTAITEVNKIKVLKVLLEGNFSMNFAMRVN